MKEIQISEWAEGGSITMRPIGFVRSSIPSQQTDVFAGSDSRIELDSGFAEWLAGIEEYSHLIVLYWLSEQKTAYATTRPQGNPEAPYVGMFACR